MKFMSILSVLSVRQDDGLAVAVILGLMGAAAFCLSSLFLATRQEAQAPAAKAVANQEQ